MLDPSQEASCAALWLLCRDPDNQVKAGEAGAVGAVVAALRVHSTHPGVQEQARPVLHLQLWRATPAAPAGSSYGRCAPEGIVSQAPVGAPGTRLSSSGSTVEQRVQRRAAARCATSP